MSVFLIFGICDNKFVSQEKMSNSIMTDACVVQLDYKMTMIDISSRLGRRDIKALKFLCTDFIPISKCEKMKTGLDILQALEHMRLICRPHNVLFLAELLWLIRRFDLLEKLNISPDDVKYSLSNTQSESRHVSPYRY